MGYNYALHTNNQQSSSLPATPGVGCTLMTVWILSTYFISGLNRYNLHSSSLLATPGVECKLLTVGGIAVGDIFLGLDSYNQNHP